MTNSNGVLAVVVEGGKGDSNIDGSKSKVRSELPFTEVAHVLAQLAGAEEIERSTVATEPQTPPRVASPWSKPRATVVFSVTGVDSDSLEQLPRVSKFVEQAEESGTAWDLKAEFYPVSGASSLATALTGQVPADHGVVANEWVEPSTGAAASPAAGVVSPRTERYSLLQSAGVSTLAAQAFADSATVLSASYSPSLAAIAAIDRRVASTAQSVSLAWSDKAAAIVSTPASAVPDLSFAAATDLPSPFDSSSPVDVAFVTELEFLKALPEILAQDESTSQTLATSSPALVYLTVSTLEAVAESYGYDSTQYAAALEAVDVVVASTLARLERFFADATTDGGVKREGAVASAVLLLGRSSEVAESVAAVVDSVVGASGLVAPRAAAGLLPHVYLAPNVEPETADTLCDSLNAGLVSAGAGTAVCFPTRAVVDVADREDGGDFVVLEGGKASSPRIRAMGSSAGVTYSTKNAAMYQAAVWTPVLLFFIFCCTSCTVCTMDYKRDPLIFRDTLSRTKID